MKFCREIKLLEALDRQAWQNLDFMDLSDKDDANFARINVHGINANTEHLALRIFEKLVDTKCWCEVMAKEMEAHTRKCRRMAPTTREFFIAFVLWLLGQLEHSSNAHCLPDKRVESVKSMLKTSLPKDRQQTLAAGLSLPAKSLRPLVEHSFELLLKVIKLGNLIVVDETILSSDSKKGAKRGCLKYIPEKPHPKGYFAHCALQKLLYSQSVVILNMHDKWNYSSPSMGASALNLILQCERYCKRSFICILDSGYPASDFLVKPQPLLKSKFLCSVSVSAVSGTLNSLAMAGQHFLKNRQTVVLYSPTLKLTTCIQGHDAYTSCIVTNAFLPKENIDEERHPLNFSVKDTKTLDSLSWPALVRIASTFDPTLPEDTNQLQDKRKMIFGLTGVDVSAPVDDLGFITASTLGQVGIVQIREIANDIGIQITSHGKPINKPQLVEAILEKHPQAAHNPKKRTAPDDTSNDSRPQRQRYLDHLKSRLLTLREPSYFAKLYLLNYGMEDRFNQLIYERFRQQLARTAEQKYSWLLLYAYIVNTWGLYKELLMEAHRAKSSKFS
jgi:hypothetical protein